MEATCEVTFQGKTSEAKAHLDGGRIAVRGAEVKLAAACADLRGVSAEGGVLTLDFEAGPVALALGEPAAGKWAGKILRPPSRLDKLGIKAGTKVHLDGEFEADFTRETSALLAPAGRSDVLLLAADDAAGLRRVAALAEQLRPEAALWVVYPKGKSAALRQEDVFAAGRAAGLVDSKVCGFSETRTALKFVIPLAKRLK